MKKITVLVMAAIMAVMVTACGNTVGDITLQAGQSAIYIQKDGSVSYAVVEAFDKDYYDKDSLEEKIENEVQEYNSGNAASVTDALKLDSFKVKKDKATLVFNFITTYDFLEYVKKYNRVPAEEFYIGTIADNTKAAIKGDFVSPDKKKTATKAEISKMTDAEILIVKDQYKVQIDGTVQFISENCTIDEDGIITTAKPDDGKSYIVYNNK